MRVATSSGSLSALTLLAISRIFCTWFFSSGVIFFIPPIFFWLVRCRVC